MRTYSTLQIELSDSVAVLTLNRPQKLNALNREMLGELNSAVQELTTGAVRAVIITGSGRAFVAGADIAEMSQMTAAEAHAYSEAGHALARALESAPYPVIAAVNGFALGGGAELALACDFIYAADTAKFGLPEVSLGLIPGFGGTQRLPRRVGLAMARELVFTGNVIDAREAQRTGLVNQVFAAAELLDAARRTAITIASRAAGSVAAAKRVMRTGDAEDLDGACALEATAFANLFGTPDQREGIDAFLNKRPAVFKGNAS